jgi:carboxymethylenebutenolidase
MAATDIKEETVHLDRNGRQMPVYIAEPVADRQSPAIIIVHEIFGLNDHIKDVTRRFAAQGLVAYAPDLFAGAGADNPPADRSDLNAMRELWQNIPDSQLIADMQAVFTMADKADNVDSQRIGTIGYCMGGAIALMFACSTPAVAWVADYYGRVRYPQLSATKPQHPLDYVHTLRSPFLGLFSAKDELIPPEDIAALTERLQSTGQHFEMKVYENAGHAFFNDRRETYNSEAATDAWKRTLQFIGNTARSTVAG